MARFVPLPVTPEPVCADCMSHGGLCASHRHEALPGQLRPLRSNWPVWLMGITHYDDAVEESPEAKKHRERKARKAKRRGEARLLAALNGERTRVAA